MISNRENCQKNASKILKSQFTSFRLSWILPKLSRFSSRFDVHQAHVNGQIAGGGRNPIMLTNPNYLTTVEDLKIRLYETCRLRPSRINIHKDGTHLDNAQYSLLYYGILPGTHFEAREILPLRTKNSLKMRVFVRTHRGYNFKRRLFNLAGKQKSI